MATRTTRAMRDEVCIYWLPCDLTVKLRGRAQAPDWSRGCRLSPRTRADTTDVHGPLQRLLDGALLTWRLVRRRCGWSARGIRPVRFSADAGHVHALIDSNTCQILRYKQQQISFSTTQVQPGGRTVVNFKSVGGQHSAAHRVAGSVSAVVTESYRTRWPYLPPVVEASAYVHPHSKVARRQRPSRLRRRMTGAPENHGSRESARGAKPLTHHGPLQRLLGARSRQQASYYLRSNVERYPD